MLTTLLERVSLHSEEGEGEEYEEIQIENLSLDQLVEYSRYGEVQLVTELVAQGLQDRLLTAMDERGNTMLHMFAANGLFDCVQAFIENCPNLDEIISKQNFEGNTALHWACIAGQITVVQLLLNAGAKLSIENKIERTPICEAYRHQRLELLSYLEERLGKKEGGDPQAKDMVEPPQPETIINTTSEEMEE